MATQRQLSARTSPFARQPINGFDQCLFETAGRLGLGDHFGGVFRQLSGRRVQPLQFRYSGGCGVMRVSSAGAGSSRIPAIVAPTATIASIGNDMAAKIAAPDDSCWAS